MTADMHRPTPAGLLVEALAPSSYAAYDTITAVVDRLGVTLTGELAQLVQVAKAEAVNRALLARPAVTVVPDDAAYEARARIGHMSVPDLTDQQIADLDEQRARFAEDDAAGTVEHETGAPA